MFDFLKSDPNEKLRNELFKNSFDEGKVIKILESGEVDLEKVDENGRTVIFELSRKKRIEAIRILSKYKANLNAEDRYGKTPLLDAISRNDKLIIKFLIEHGADINHKSSSGRTVLQDVALESDAKIFKLCISYKPILEEKDVYGKTVLFDAVESGNIEILQEVLNNIENPNILDNSGQTALFNAVLQTNKEISKILISYGVDINITDKNRQNVLFNAIILGSDNITLIELLLRKGVKINLKDIEDRTISEELLYILNLINDPYSKAEGKYKLARKERNYFKLIHILINYGLSIDRTDQFGKTLLFKEVERKNYDTIEFLISAGAELNASDNDGRTVLFDSVLEGSSSLPMIDFLISKGANINQRDNMDKTVLDDIIELILITENNKKASNPRFLRYANENEDYFGMLRKILMHKPKINQQRSDGRTILFDVIIYDNLKLLKVLLNNSADLNILDHDNNTPISLLIEHGVNVKTPKEKEKFMERLIFLLKFRININTVDKNGRTIFHKAVIANDVKVVERLLGKRADLNIKDKQGRTALHHTQWKGNHVIARLLISAGANMDEPDYAGFTILNYSAIFGHIKLVVLLINMGVLMYNKNKKSKAVVKFFLEREKNLTKLLSATITDKKLKDAITQVITNLRNELIQSATEYGIALKGAKK